MDFPLIFPVGTRILIRDSVRRYGGQIGKIRVISRVGSIEYGISFGKSKRVTAWFLEKEFSVYQPKFQPIISFRKNA